MKCSVRFVRWGRAWALYQDSSCFFVVNDLRVGWARGLPRNFGVVGESVWVFLFSIFAMCFLTQASFSLRNFSILLSETSLGARIRTPRSGWIWIASVLRDDLTRVYCMARIISVWIV